MRGDLFVHVEVRTPTRLDDEQEHLLRQLAELRYKGQVGLYLEVTDAQAALVQAENNQVDAVYNYLVARAQFQNAVGTPQVR